MQKKELEELDMQIVEFVKVWEEEVGVVRPKHPGDMSHEYVTCLALRRVCAPRPVMMLGYNNAGRHESGGANLGRNGC